MLDEETTGWTTRDAVRLDAFMMAGPDFKAAPLQEPQFPPICQTDLAYMAGLLDGEGCVRLARSGTTYVADVRIVNTNQAVIDWLQSMVGGHVFEMKRSNAAWKRAFVWRVNCARALDFLERVYPHLRIKDGQARALFAWDALRLTRGNHVAGRRDEYREAAKFVVEQISWLNRRGSGDKGESPIDRLIE